MIRWYEGIPPVTALIRCRGELHRISWRRGRVSADDHDIPAELALLALGGQSCACVDVVRAARARLGVEELFLLWTEHAEPSVGASQALERWVRRVGATGPPDTVQGRRAEEARSAALSSLPVQLRRRLAFGVFEAIGREVDVDRSGSHPSFAPVFGSLLDRAVRSVSPPTPAPDRLDLRWKLIPPDERATVEGSCRGRVGGLRLGLSAAWVARVWAWDLAVVDGGLVVDAVHQSPCQADVAVVRWSDEGRAELEWRTARRSEQGWQLEGSSAIATAPAPLAALAPDAAPSFSA